MSFWGFFFWCCAVCVLLLSHGQLFEIPRTVAHQAPLSMGFPRQEYWSEWPFPPPGDLPHPGIKPMSLLSPVLADGFLPTRATWESESESDSVQYCKVK